MEELDLDYRRMDGQTPVAERQERIDEFNNNASVPVFLLSTRGMWRVFLSCRSVYFVLAAVADLNRLRQLVAWESI
jgi:hypothetical protein